MSEYCKLAGWGECPKKVKKETNADKIRAMTDEELAEFLERFGTFNQPCSLSFGEPLNWLQSEVE